MTLLLITAVTILASAAPVWRAVSIDPASALRHE
jgi:ABC-type lipoprotein release transport system permease subunit